MKKSTKIVLITAAVLTAVGMILIRSVSHLAAISSTGNMSGKTERYRSYCFRTA